MANIQEVENKTGITYKINVHLGYDAQGKKITKCTTFKPDPQKNAKQNEKDLQKFAMDFEERVKNGNVFDGEKELFEDSLTNGYQVLKIDVPMELMRGIG